MAQVYDWKRFWTPREGRVSLIDGGYLFDPHSEWGHLYNSDVVPFDSIASTPCLALLGEPGIGKSFAMEAEQSEIKAKIEAEGGQVIWLDLRSYGSEDRLVNDLFLTETFVFWLSGKHQLHIFLDSLDECLLRIDNLATLLVDELKKYPVERVHFRIACRTADWPNVLEKGLRALWGDDALGVYELAPLRRVDVERAARANELDSEVFLRAIDQKEVVPLAIKPVTLRFLLNTYQSKGGFPSTQKDLYTDGCRLLCEEVNESRIGSGRTGTLTAEQRLMIASRIAAVTVFGNKYAIYTGVNYGDAPEEDVTLQELAGGTEAASGSELEVTAASIEEVIATGLFSSRGSQRIGWAHQTYCEFLAAWYVFHRGLSLRQVKSLIVHPGDPEHKLVPQLHETAAWLAGMVPDVFRMIMQTDPEVLLRSDVATADVQDRASLVESLLRLYEEEKLLDWDFDLRRQYRKLNHPGLADQLRPYITDSSKGMLVRRVATDIAEACELNTLQGDLANIALNTSDPLLVRVNAAYAVNRIGDKETRGRLKPLAYGEAGEDPEDELKGCGLTAVWPDHITAQDLFALLTQPKRPSLTGAYQMFLSREIASHLQPSDLPLALHWVERFRNRSDWHVFDQLQEAITIKAWDHLDIPGVMQALARTYLSQLKSSERSLTIEISDEDNRHRLVVEMVQLLAEFDLSYTWLITSSPLVKSGDLFWLIERLTLSESIEEQRAFAGLIDRTTDFRDVDQVDAIVIASQGNAILAETLAWTLLPVELESPQAEQMKKNYLEMQQWQTDRGEQPLLEPPPEKRIADLLDKCEEGSLTAWWRLNMEMTLEPNSQYYGSELSSDLIGLPGWKSANALTRSRIVEGAKRYILEAEPEADKWFGTNILHRPAFAGYRALLLLLRSDPEFLLTVQPRVWGKWVPIIVAYPTGSEGEGRKKQKELICLAYRQAPDDIIRTLLDIIDNENREGFPSVVEKVEECFDDQLTDVLLTKLEDPDLKPGTIGSLLKPLLDRRVPEARSLIESLLASPLPADTEGRSKAIVAARLLLIETEDAGWSVVWPVLLQDADFAQEVISSIAHTYDMAAATFGQKLTENQTADLYIWLVRKYPYAEDPHFEEAHSVGPRETIGHWRDAILNHLTQRGSNEACEALSRVIRELPEVEWLKWKLLEARSMARRKTWTPPSPSDVIKIGASTRSSLIQNGDQLLEILIEALKRLESKLQGETPAAVDLWNEIRKNVYRPKDENHFSDYVKRFLDDDLKREGIIVNREVEIRRGMGGKPGEETDILVDAVVRDASKGILDTISAIIEVKGCWNPKVDSDMRTQLLDRYLEDNSCRFGLYLVGWFNCPQWDQDDYRKKQCALSGIAEVQEQFDQQAESLSSQGVSLRALVVNAALR